MYFASVDHSDFSLKCYCNKCCVDGPSGRLRPSLSGEQCVLQKSAEAPQLEQGTLCFDQNNESHVGLILCDSDFLISLFFRDRGKWSVSFCLMQWPSSRGPPCVFLLSGRKTTGGPTELHSPTADPLCVAGGLCSSRRGYALQFSCQTSPLWVVFHSAEVGASLLRRKAITEGPPQEVHMWLYSLNLVVPKKSGCSILSCTCTFEIIMLPFFPVM